MVHQRTKNYYGRQEGFSVFSFFFLRLKASIAKEIAPGNLGPRRSAAAEEEDPFAEDNAPVRGAAFCDMYLLEEPLLIWGYDVNSSRPFRSCPRGKSLFTPF